MSHHSEHEIAQNFIQRSGVIAVMSEPRQKWGKIMAVRFNWLLNNKNAADPAIGIGRGMRQRQ
jgi:hypothetical protein